MRVSDDGNKQGRKKKERKEASKERNQEGSKQRNNQPSTGGAQSRKLGEAGEDGRKGSAESTQLGM
jgi:hypothetical protein